MTEDDQAGGLDVVLARVLQEFGLPPEAGLTGLLRHMQANRVMTETILHQHIELMQNRIAAFLEGVRKLKEDGTVVSLFVAADMMGVPAGKQPDNDLLPGWPGRQTVTPGQSPGQPSGSDGRPLPGEGT